MSQRRLSPTKTISERGTGSALTAWSKSLREGLMLEVSDEKTVTTKRSSTPARLNSSSQRSFRDKMLATKPRGWERARLDRKSTRLNSSHSQISYAVFCLKKKNRKKKHHAESSRSIEQQLL